MRTWCRWFVVLFLTSPVVAAPLPERKPLTADEIAKCQQLVQDFLAKKKADGGMLTPVKEEAVQKQFPRHAVFTLLFRQYPVARVNPEGFSSSNILICDEQGKVELLDNAKKLEAFFKANATPAKTDDDLKAVARVWLRLAQEYHQDGFYKFAAMDDATKVSGKSVSVTSVVMQGGSGMVAAKVSFDEAGKLASVADESKIKPGPRPICQATKLLDADPLVRRIAEQDLLIMGTAAKPYLDEQRARATPELQRAIDALWLRIVASEK